MAVLILTCPNCETKNEISAENLKLECGRLTYIYQCKSCANDVDGEEPYWRWLGLEKAPLGKANG